MFRPIFSKFPIVHSIVTAHPNSSHEEQGAPGHSEDPLRPTSASDSLEAVGLRARRRRRRRGPDADWTTTTGHRTDNLLLSKMWLDAFPPVKRHLLLHWRWQTWSWASLLTDLSGRRAQLVMWLCGTTGMCLILQPRAIQSPLLRGKITPVIYVPWERQFPGF